MKTLFANGYVLIKENDGFTVTDHAYLGVENDRICFLSTQAPTEPFDSVIDMRGKLLMPGLYNCHTHSAMVLFRGIGSDLPLDRWLYEKIFPLEQKLNYEAVLAGSYLAIMEMLACGTVSFSDMYFFPEATAEAVLHAGIKANLTRHIQSEKNIFDRQGIQASLDFYERYDHAGNGRIFVDFSLHSEYACAEQTAREYSRLCYEKGGRMHIHLAETTREYEDCIRRNGKSPVAWFYDCGTFASKTAAAHCVALDENDIRILKENQVSVVHNPSSNLKLGSGFAKIPEMIDQGVTVALGTDGAASNNNLNMFEEMHLAAIIHNGRQQNSMVMNDDTVLNMATGIGARLQGRQDCGELKVGNKADIIAIDLSAPHLCPRNDLKSLLVYSAQASDVCMVMVDGKLLYRNGEFLTIDRERVLYNIEKTRIR